MSSRLVALCFDANDPLRLARFWAVALDWQVDDETDDAIGLVPTDDTRFRILFRPVPEEKTGKNCIHLDLTTTSIEDQEETVGRLLERGARHVDVGQGPDDGHVVLADPEGNELCIIEPDNAFLAGCGRLGSITCDGSREVGCFWSEALGWPLVWDQDEETAIRAPDGRGPFITWGPPVPANSGKNRLHLDIAPRDDGDQRAEVERLVSLGATPIDIGQGDVDWVVMADPDGNEFCVLRVDEAGKAIGMPDPATWSIEYHVREDAESMFVPLELLPHARPGDVVEIRSLQPPVTRRGRVSTQTTDPRDGFVTVTLD